MSKDRTTLRNIHIIWNGESIGGCYQAGSITEENLLWMLHEILLIADGSWSLNHQESGRDITTSSNVAAVGNYVIQSNRPIKVTNEIWTTRVISYAISGRDGGFAEKLRARDGRCVVSGQVNSMPNVSWSNYHAAHIFPLASENIWMHENFGRWITNMSDTTGISKINSIQNGVIMRADLHGLFDQYIFSINPDDGYKIVCFAPDDTGIDGRILHPVCRDKSNPDHVVDQVLRWHFRQAVLANMRGAGEPIFETDFSGRDMMEVMRTEPYGRERFEQEMQLRLRDIGGVTSR